MPAKFNVFVVPHTHWDRAWYVPFEEFRIRLVRLIDRVCDTLEKDPRFTSFCLDGQTVVLEDYLQIRPERKERLKALIEKRRLWVGPWYILPDEFLVSAESIVRNLMLGHTISAEFGHTMDVGYVPDPFGHIAQLPQILHGFGLDTFVFSRGLDSALKLPLEFYWSAPDGSSLLAMHQARFYNNAAFLGYRIPWGDPEQMVLDRQLAMQQIETACSDLASATRTHTLLLNNGVDHSEHQPELPKLLEAAAAKFPQYRFRIASFEDYAKAVKRDLAGVRLPKHEGELIYRYGDMLHGVYSTRMYLKMANQQSQDLLEKAAEPLSALAWFTKSGEYPRELLWYAWRELLKCHPHADICGCSGDQVHDDMEHRFGVVKQVGSWITRNALRAIGRNLDHSKQDGIPVMVFNPLGFARNETVAVEIDLSRAREPWKYFALFDERGREVAYELLRSEDRAWLETLKGFDVRRHTVRLQLELPPLGYRTLYVREGRPGKMPQIPKGVVIGDRTFENAFYKLSIAAGGSIGLYDKRSKMRYKDLMVFEDMEDCGDVYNWSYLPKGSQTLTTAGKRATVKRVHRDAFSATWRIAHTLRVPRSLNANRSARARETVTLAIVSEVTCYADSPRIDVVTRVENTAEDHRLRVLFPTGIATDAVSVDGHYAVIERPVALPPRRGNMPPYPTQHQGRFVDLSDGKKGFAVINKGMPEFEVISKGARRTLALTLFRSVGWLSREDFPTRPGHTGPPIDTPGAQCLRHMEFRYAFMAHPGDWTRVMSEALAHNFGILATRCDIHGGTVPQEVGFMKNDAFMCGQPVRPLPREGVLPDRGSFIDIGSTKAVLSAVKKCESRNSLIIRFYNPGGETVKGSIKALRPIRQAFLTNLNEQRLKRARVVKGEVPYTCGPRKVITIEIV
ncbi:MAG: hypothetical protein IT364_20750 [Candidatus Hydrogenedentes bacterium]|nr:hypothetical protein [Candidatus Hydrogenedentota bacterium]